MSRQNDLFKGEFNYQGETHVLYRHAPEGQEWMTLTNALAKKLGVIHWTIRNYFSGEKDNFKIQREVPKIPRKFNKQKNYELE